MREVVGQPLAFFVRPAQALILAISERVEEDATEDELLSWRRVLLSYPASFKSYDTDDAIYFQATNLRIKMKGLAKTTTHRTSQIIFDIYNYKVRKARMQP